MSCLQCCAILPGWHVAWPGMAGHGWAWHGMAWHELVRHGSVPMLLHAVICFPAYASRPISRHGMLLMPCPHLLRRIPPPPTPCGRLKSVAFVSKRFSALSLCADERRVTIKITGARAVERARQLLLWLPRHAPCIKFLGVEMAAGPAEDGQPAADADLAEVDNLTACCLSAFGVLGGGQLEQLTVEPGTVLSTTAWLPTLRRLQRLAIGSIDQELLLTGPLHLLAEAEEFQLTGGPIKFGEGVQLPPALTHLRLKDKMSEAMPAQVRHRGPALGLPASKTMPHHTTPCCAMCIKRVPSARSGRCSSGL